MEIQNINLDLLATNPIQPEWRTEKNQLRQLLNSIQTVGLLEPISVKRVNGKYEIINGHRRTQCFKDLGKETIPAVISDVDAMEGFIACNTTAKPIRRKDYVGIYLKGGTPPRVVMNHLIIVVDKLGKSFIEEMIGLNLSAEVTARLIVVAGILNINLVDDIKNFIAWTMRHRTAGLIRNLEGSLKQSPNGSNAKKIKTAFANDEPLKIEIK